jgi:putative SOS response-associated peptidase YedK
MCNLYSITTNQAAISALFRVVNRYVGNLAPMPGVFPDYRAPIIRTGADGRELVTARWGMPSSQHALLEATKKRATKLEAKGKPVDFKELLRMEPDSGTTNIRNVKSKHWTRWLGAECGERWGNCGIRTAGGKDAAGLLPGRPDQSWRGLLRGPACR